MDENVAINLNSVYSCPEYFSIAKDTVNEVITLEQQGNWGEALKKLGEVLEKIDEIARKTDHCGDLVTDEIETLRKEILDHIGYCNRQLLSHIESIAPPSYEEAMSTTASLSSAENDRNNFPSTSSTTISYNDLGTVLQNLKTNIGAQSAQLIYSCEDVTLYLISKNGTVSVSAESDIARIFEIEDGNCESLPKYYLQIYTFVYPLIPKISPCVRTEFGAIILPNINVEHDTDPDVESIGLIVKKEKEEEFLNTLENILQTKIVYCDTNSEDHVSVKISDSITTGALYVSNLLVNGAQKAEQFLDNTTPKLIDRINPADGNRRVAPCVSNGIKVAKDVTAITASVTGFVASKVGTATMMLGQYLAPHIKRGGGRILCSTTGMSEDDASNKMNAVFNVTAGAVEGIGTLYTGLEQSARIFGQSLSNNTVQLVTHKYGYAAGEFADDTFQTVGNGIQIGTHVRMFRPTKIAKIAARGAIVSESKSLRKNSQNEVDPSLARSRSKDSFERANKLNLQKSEINVPATREKNSRDEISSSSNRADEDEIDVVFQNDNENDLPQSGKYSSMEVQSEDNLCNGKRPIVTLMD